MVTRTLLLCYLATGLAWFLQVLPVMQVYHTWSKELTLPIPQLWRLITNFLVVGKPSINYLFQLVWLYVVEWHFIDLSIVTLSHLNGHHYDMVFYQYEKKYIFLGLYEQLQRVHISNMQGSIRGSL